MRSHVVVDTSKGQVEINLPADDTEARKGRTFMLMGAPGPEFKGTIISVRTKDLTKKLKENREKHTKDFAEAVEDHKKALIAYFEKQLVLAKEGKETDRLVPFEEPTSHERDYNCVIAMLEMCTKEEIYVSEQEFKHFVMDDWDWKDHFASSAAVYKATARGR